jgi:hypothetical protein
MTIADRKEVGIIESHPRLDLHHPPVVETREHIEYLLLPKRQRFDELVEVGNAGAKRQRGGIEGHIHTDVTGTP